MSTDMMALRGYVTAMDGHDYDLLPEGTIKVTVTHNLLKAQFWELKFDLHTPIATIKDRCYRHTGTPGEWQELVLKSGGAAIARLDDDSKQLGFYSAKSGMEIHVIDTNPHSMAKGGGLEDVNLIKKYEMTDEEYDKRENTLRAYARKQRETNPDFKFFPKPKKEMPDRPDCESKECVEHVDVGARCQVTPGARRGTVMFVGTIEGLQSGYWVGVKFDEPVGKGDGTRNGKRIFECEPKYGAFARPYNVECGDFPARDIFDDLDSSDDEDEAGAAAAGVKEPEAAEGASGPTEEAKPSEEADEGAAGAAGSADAGATEDASAAAPAPAAAEGEADGEDDDEL